MRKYLDKGWKVTLIVLAILTLIIGTIIYNKRDEIITSNITMRYFSEVVNSNNEKAVKSFVAKSNNNVLYENFSSTLNHVYHFEGVSDFKFEITDTEVFGNGKYQCYFSTAFENYIPKCDLENEQRYMNYIIDMDVSYKLNDKEYKNKEKGLVVFVKDMAEGNYFTWKLVRFDRYKLENN